MPRFVLICLDVVAWVVAIAGIALMARLFSMRNSGRGSGYKGIKIGRFFKKMRSAVWDGVLNKAILVGALLLTGAVQSFNLWQEGVSHARFALRLVGALAIAAVGIIAALYLLKLLFQVRSGASKVLASTMEYTLVLLLLCFFGLILDIPHTPSTKAALWVALWVNYLVNLVNMLLMVLSAKNNPMESKLLLKGSFAIVGVFILELTLMQYACSLFVPDAFNKALTLFDSFYFTIITFATIGYGDIYPLAVQSKAVCAATAVTSMICLVVFINTILSLVQSKSE